MHFKHNKPETYWALNYSAVNVFHVQLSRDLGQIRASEPLKLPRLQAPKQNTSNPFPVVSSRQVGWRSGKRECRLEVYGRWGRPKYSIIKQLHWPNDAVPWKLYLRKQYSLHFCVVAVLVEWLLQKRCCCLVTFNRSMNIYWECGCGIVYLCVDTPMKVS